MMRPRHAAPALILVLLSLISLQNSPISHSGAPGSSPSNVSIHLVGLVNGWNGTDPTGTNPTITVNQGDIVSITLTSADIDHQFALDLDHDGAMPIGLCPTGDMCSSVFRSSAGTTITFTAGFAPGAYVYFCTFHPTMVGSFIVRPVPPDVVIAGVSPNPAYTGTPITLTYAITNPATLSGVSIDWGDGTITHPSTTSTSDTHSYSTTGYFESQTFTINVTATNSAGQAFATLAETVNDRAATLTISNLSPNPAETGQSVDLSFTASDPDGTVEATWIDWGDGSLPDLILNETSGSMCQRLNPSLNSDLCTLAPGDLLFSRPTDPASIVNGSIIIFRPYPATPDYLVTHRVIKIIPATDSIYDQITFWTEGDANAVPDGWDQANAGIPASQVVALYQHTLPPPGTPPARHDTHTYSSLGDLQSKTYTIRINATDNNQLASLQTISETIIDQPPVLTINKLSPTATNAGQTVTISFSATDPDGTISSFTINWGDGSTPDMLTASATSDTHTFAKAGSFTIIITAADNSGSSSQLSTSPFVVDSSSNPTAPATILGLTPIEFYSLIGVITAIITIATILGFRRARKP